MDEKMIIKGIPEKNRTARILVGFGLLMALASFAVSLLVFYYGKGYKSFGYGYGGTYYWCINYNDDFANFFASEFLNISCYYGYMLIVGLIMTIVGAIMKDRTEKCEIMVSDKRIMGKLASGISVEIPLNQITAINSSSYNGISVSAIGRVSDFHCIQNSGDIIRVISNLLSTPRTMNKMEWSEAAYGVSDDVEQLKQLKGLLDDGIITAEEFQKKKTDIMSRLN